MDSEVEEGTEYTVTHRSLFGDEMKDVTDIVMQLARTPFVLQCTLSLTLDSG